MVLEKSVGLFCRLVERQSRSQRRQLARVIVIQRQHKVLPDSSRGDKAQLLSFAIVLANGAAADGERPEQQMEGCAQHLFKVGRIRNLLAQISQSRKGMNQSLSVCFHQY